MCIPDITLLIKGKSFASDMSPQPVELLRYHRQLLSFSCRLFNIYRGIFVLLTTAHNIVTCLKEYKFGTFPECPDKTCTHQRLHSLKLLWCKHLPVYRKPLSCHTSNFFNLIPLSLSGFLQHYTRGLFGSDQFTLLLPGRSGLHPYWTS